MYSVCFLLKDLSKQPIQGYSEVGTHNASWQVICAGCDDTLQRRRDTTPVYLSPAAVCGHYDKPGVPEVL